MNMYTGARPSIRVLSLFRSIQTACVYNNHENIFLLLQKLNYVLNILLALSMYCIQLVILGRRQEYWSRVVIWTGQSTTVTVLRLAEVSVYVCILVPQRPLKCSKVSRHCHFGKTGCNLICLPLVKKLEKVSLCLYEKFLMYHFICPLNCNNWR